MWIRGPNEALIANDVRCDHDRAHSTTVTIASPAPTAIEHSAIEHHADRRIRRRSTEPPEARPAREARARPSVLRKRFRRVPNANARALTANGARNEISRREPCIEEWTVRRR